MKTILFSRYYCAQRIRGYFYNEMHAPYKLRFTCLLTPFEAILECLRIKLLRDIGSIWLCLTASADEFTRLCPARHLRTWLTTYTWFRKVQDVGSARPPTDRVLSTTAIFWQFRWLLLRKL